MDRNNVDVENVVDEIWPEKLKPQKCIETLLTLSRLTLFFRRLQFHFDCLKHREEFGECVKPPISNRRSRGKKQSTLLRKANFRILRLMSSNAHRPFKSTFRIFSLSPFLFLSQILCCLFCQNRKTNFRAGQFISWLGKGGNNASLARGLLQFTSFTFYTPVEHVS